MNHAKSIIPLFLLIIIDGMSFGMTLPVLAPLLTKTGASIFGAHASLERRHILFGIILFLPPFAYFFGAPIVGYCSDRFGRKTLLGYCLLGTFIAYVMYVISFRWMSLSLLIIARIIGGFTTGSQAVAQAAMTDISSGTAKLLNIGVIALAMTIGLLAGPLLGGVLSNAHYVHWFGLSTPFYAAAGLTALNFLLLVFYLKETHSDLSHIPLRKSLKQFLSHRPNQHLLTIFFFFELSWSLYYQGIAVTAVQAFHLDGSEVGYFSTYIGLMLSLSLMFVLRACARLLKPKKLLSFSLWLGIVSLLLAFFAHKLWQQCLLAIPVTIMTANVYSTLITLLSNENADNKQGLVMGVSDSALSLAFAITGFLAGWITLYNAMSPLLLSCGFLVLAYGVFCFKKVSKALRACL